MEKLHCREGYLISAWALSGVQNGCKSTAEKLVKILFVPVPLCRFCPPHSLSLTSLLKMRSRALWYSSSLSSTDLLCLSWKGWRRFCCEEGKRGQVKSSMGSKSIRMEISQMSCNIGGQTDLVI